jgi:hypothetical protein
MMRINLYSHNFSRISFLKFEFSGKMPVDNIKYEAWKSILGQETLTSKLFPLYICVCLETFIRVVIRHELYMVIACMKQTSFRFPFDSGCIVSIWRRGKQKRNNIMCTVISAEKKAFYQNSHVFHIFQSSKF